MESARGNRSIRLIVLVLASGLIGSSAANAQSREQRGVPRGDVQSWFLQWPLPEGAEQYADIDGRRMHRYVVEQAEISRRYRDEVHPKFWGRITGTSADAESAEWLADKFRTAGLSDVRIQKLDLLPQWFPGTYRVTVTASGKTVELGSAQPFYRSVGTPPEGLELEAVYVGLGAEADFLGRDVRGKAVFTYSMLGAPSESAWRRAETQGAAAVFDAQMLPGNLRYQAYPSGTNVPAFTLGGADGKTVQDLLGESSGARVRVHVRLDVEMVPNLETALVWGTLPGASDETVYLIAHRDGWFDAAGDNASGVASIIELAAHYARIPQTERARTLVFVGLDGHHNSGDGAGVGRMWMVENRDQLFEKTALMINAEHPSTVQTTSRPRYMRGEIFDRELVWTNTYTGQQWYAGGPSRPELERIALDAFREFGVTIYPDPNPRPPAGDLGRFYTFLPGVATSEFHHYFHTDLETPDTVPWTGLEATTRAYARIIDEVNRHPLSVFQRPEERENP